MRDINIMEAKRSTFPVMCATQLVGGLLLKMLKYFKVILNIFEFSHVKRNCRILISLFK